MFIFENTKPGKFAVSPLSSSRRWLPPSPPPRRIRGWPPPLQATAVSSLASLSSCRRRELKDPRCLLLCHCWGVDDDGIQTRSHLKAQLASSLALKSPNEYRQCLMSYVRYIAREADESRLREVCESFLGPPTGMGGATISDPNIAWDHSILGLKKHKFLREDILQALASNKKVQRLLNEFMDLFSEYRSVETHMEQNNSMLPMTATQAIDRVDMIPSLNDMQQVDPLVLDQKIDLFLNMDMIPSAPH